MRSVTWSYFPSRDVLIEPASEALVFQLVSYTGAFKCPVAYFYTNKTSAELQYNLIKMIMEKLHEVKVYVRSVTYDGTATNLSTFKELGCDLGAGQTYFPHPSKPELAVWPILDACHMMKLAKNALADLRVIEPEEGLIKWDYVFKLNQVQEEMKARFANKLSNAHLRYISKIMNVKLAAQTLSCGVADALDYLAVVHPEFKETGATVTFFGT